MKVDEVMIGHVVSEKVPLDLTNSVWETKELTLTDLSVMSKHPNTYKGIKLTQDILIKTGFLKDGHRFWLDGVKLEGSSRIVETDTYIGFYHNDNRIEYVHQLQLVYYAHNFKQLKITV